MISVDLREEEINELIEMLIENEENVRETAEDDGLMDSVENYPEYLTMIRGMIEKFYALSDHYRNEPLPWST